MLQLLGTVWRRGQWGSKIKDGEFLKSRRSTDGRHDSVGVEASPRVDQVSQESNEATSAVPSELEGFNQNIEKVTLPESLEALTFGGSFNQSLAHAELPTNLKSSLLLLVV